MKPEVPLLQVRSLSLNVRTSGQPIVKDVSFSIDKGEIVGVVGESGSGKTMLARSILRLQPEAIAYVGGTVDFAGSDVMAMTKPQLRTLRGKQIGMILQEPMTALSPSMRLGDQLEEGLILHTQQSRAARRELICGMLSQVGISDPQGALSAYPHQFSGGMRQRMLLASVMLLRPRLIIADEPTTALDAIVQRDVLELMLGMARQNNTAVIFISHDLPTVAQFTERMLIMRQGEVVEQGPTSDVISHPKTLYTQRLLNAIPRRGRTRDYSRQGTPLVEVRDLRVAFDMRRSFLSRRSHNHALRGINLSIQRGEVFAVVGASGSGKTTVGRVITGLVEPTGGAVMFKGRRLDAMSAAERADYRKNCQMVFQDPASSLDPRMKTEQLVLEPLRRRDDMTSSEKRTRVRDVLSEAGLGPEFLARYPHQLSGGQRQRVAIARAIVGRPEFVVADEAVSALDATIRLQVLELFQSLQKKYGFAVLFITHDLSVVEQIADRVMVMRDGLVVEEGSRDDVLDRPRDRYTKKLLSAVPYLKPGLHGGVQLSWRAEASA